jgi:hypothetical protein
MVRVSVLLYLRQYRDVDPWHGILSFPPHYPSLKHMPLTPSSTLVYTPLPGTALIREADTLIEVTYE